MADEFGDHLFSVPTYQPKPRPAPAPSPPDEGVDPFGQTFETPAPEPDQPAPVTVEPPVVTLPAGSTDTGTGTDTETVPTRPDGETEFSRLQFTGTAEQAAEIEREQQVGREILLRRYLRGEEIAPTSRNQLREALGITNAEAAHLGLSDFSDGPDLREDPAAFAATVATINRERQERHEQALAQYLVDRERYEQYLADRAAYEEAQGQGGLAEPEPIAPPDDGVDPFNPREWKSGRSRKCSLRLWRKTRPKGLTRSRPT